MRHCGERPSGSVRLQQCQSWADYITNMFVLYAPVVRVVPGQLIFVSGLLSRNYRFLLSESSHVDHGARGFTRVHRIGSKGFSMADLPKVISAKAAARFVGLSQSTLAKLRLNGNGPIYCKLGRRVVYRPADLEQWLQSRTTRDTSDADARFLRALTIAHPR
jgi:predicted DNA-binding transcriptional regulator AlpA